MTHTSKVLSRYKFLFFVTTMAIISIIIPVCLTEIASKFIAIDPIEKFQIDSLTIASAIIFAPVVETAIFQEFPFAVLKKVEIRFKEVFISLGSSFLFAISHSGLAMQLSAFFAGLILCTTFVTSRKFGFHPLWTTALVHSLRNSIVVILTAVFSR